MAQVKRVLKFGGQYICFTLTESHVLGKKQTGFFCCIYFLVGLVEHVAIVMNIRSTFRIFMVVLI